MKIAGLTKLTLLDFPGRLACIVFTGGCNYRCPYCHNASLVDKPAGGGVSEAEFFAFLESREGKLEGVVLSGGEPLLQAGLLPFVQKIKALGFAVKLDTNGTHPEKLRELLPLLDYAAMDIKNAPEKYALTTGTGDPHIEAVAESARLLTEFGGEYEFRTTAARELHTPADMESIGRWLAGAKRYFLQNFKDSGDILGSGCSPLSKAELNALLSAVRPFIPAAEIRGG